MGGMEPVRMLLSGLNNLNTFANLAVPVIQTASQVKSGLATFGQDADAARREALRAQQDLALAQLKKQQGLNLRLAGEQTALEKQRIALAALQDETARRNALKRAISRQRAQFGGQGVGSAGGSSEAVLLGLFDESDEERVERGRLDALRYNALDLDLDQQRRLNVLQKTQLKERQKLERIAEEY